MKSFVRDVAPKVIFIMVINVIAAKWIQFEGLDITVHMKNVIIIMIYVRFAIKGIIIDMK